LSAQRDLNSILLNFKDMKAETKKSLKSNTPILLYAIIIIITVILSDFIKIWTEPGTAELVIVMMAFLIVWQVIAQALQNEPEKTRKKISVIISITLVVLAVLGLIAFILFQYS
jgi:D-alanyl-lipoteichoic acid acyltransferase DltB (MBOAT superfamily)